MPRQLNFTVIGVSLFRPFAIAAVQVSRHLHKGGTKSGTAGAAHGRGHLVVCNSWGEIPEADVESRTIAYAEWFESSTVAFVTPQFSLLPEIAPDTLWSTVTVSESDARSAIADSSRASDAELIRRCGRLSYSTGRAAYTWADAVTGTKAVKFSQAIAAGAAAWFGREVVKQLASRRNTQAKDKQASH